MKSIINTAPPKVTTYPRLMRYPDGMVVLIEKVNAMNRLASGMVVGCPDNVMGIGSWSESWDTEDLIDFDGTITLTNRE